MYKAFASCLVASIASSAVVNTNYLELAQKDPFGTTSPAGLVFKEFVTKIVEEQNDDHTQTSTVTITGTLRDGKSIGEKENLEFLGCSDEKPNKDPLEYACVYIKIDSTSIAYEFYPLITTAQLPTT